MFHVPHESTTMYNLNKFIIPVFLMNFLLFDHSLSERENFKPEVLQSFVDKQRGLSIVCNCSEETKILIHKWISKQNLKCHFYSQFENDMKKLLMVFYDPFYLQKQININQQIYFVTKDNKVLEKYTINNHTITQFIGYFNGSSLIAHHNVSSNFVIRRSNFHGIQFKGAKITVCP